MQRTILFDRWPDYGIPSDVMHSHYRPDDTKEANTGGTGCVGRHRQYLVQ